MVVVCKEVALHPAAGQRRWQEALCKQIVWRGQHTAGVLKSTVGVVNLGHYHADIRIVFHVSDKGSYYVALPADIGVHYQMELRANGERLGNGDVVACPEASILYMVVYHSRRA